MNLEWHNDEPGTICGWIEGQNYWDAGGYTIHRLVDIDRDSLKRVVTFSAWKNIRDGGDGSNDTRSHLGYFSTQAKAKAACKADAASVSSN